MSNKNSAGDVPKTGARAVYDFIQASIKPTGEKISPWAERVGLNASLMSQWKNGPTVTPEIEHLNVAADALGRRREELRIIARIDQSEDGDMPEPTPKETWMDGMVLDPDMPDHVKRTILGLTEIYKHTPKA